MCVCGSVCVCVCVRVALCVCVCVCVCHLLGVPDLGSVRVHHQQLLVPLTGGEADLLHPAAVRWDPPEGINTMKRKRKMSPPPVDSNLCRWFGVRGSHLDKRALRSQKLRLPSTSPSTRVSPFQAMQAMLPMLPCGGQEEDQRPHIRDLRDPQGPQGPSGSSLQFLHHETSADCFVIRGPPSP